MIDMPKEVVVRKILEQTDLSQEEIDEKIKEKLKQLSGLISEEGAAHIVANDAGVQLYKTEGMLKISELSTAAKSATIAVKVLKKYEKREFERNGRKGQVANALVGDDSARMRIVFWNDQVERWDLLKEGDIMRIKNPFVKENNGRLEIHLNDRSTLEVNPAGVTVELPERNFDSDKPKRELKYLRDLTGDEAEVEVLGTIVQVYDPRFFTVCPECNRRVNDQNMCGTHGEVKPVLNYVTSCFLDDGTGNIRTTFWKNQSQHLFGLSDEEIVKWKDDPAAAEPHKHELLGEIIKIVGRPKKNDQFERMELTANFVFKDVDPEKELARLEEKAKAPVTAPDEKPKEAVAPSDSSTTPPQSSAVEAQTPEALEHAVASKSREVEEKAESPETVKTPEPKAEEVVEIPVEGNPGQAAPDVPHSSEEREVKPEDVKFSDGDEIESVGEEEVISIDDLEDLD